MEPTSGSELRGNLGESWAVSVRLGGSWHGAGLSRCQYRHYMIQLQIGHVSRVQWVELRHVTRGDNITIYTQREIMSHAAEIESLME